MKIILILRIQKEIICLKKKRSTFCDFSHTVHVTIYVMRPVHRRRCTYSSVFVSANSVRTTVYMQNEMLRQNSCVEFIHLHSYAVEYTSESYVDKDVCKTVWNMGNWVCLGFYANIDSPLRKFWVHM